MIFDWFFIDFWSIFGGDFALIFHQVLQVVWSILGPLFEASAVAGSPLCGALDPHRARRRPAACLRLLEPGLQRLGVFLYVIFQ